jgi:two-component system CheB/CheR fusion protein
MLASIKHPLLILDESLRVIWANAAFHDTFNVTNRELTGKSLKSRWPQPRLLELLHQTAATGIPFKNFSASFELSTGGRRAMSVEGSVIPSQGGQGSPRLILAIFEVKTTRRGTSAKPPKTQKKPRKMKTTMPRGRATTDHKTR